MRRGKERAGSVFIPLEWFPASLSNLYILQNKKKKGGQGSHQGRGTKTTVQR